jgi:alkylation response protein AidB-like acyl-CoA dehydrogenase
LARPEGGDYVLEGSKMWITSGAQAGAHVVFARTDAGERAQGISCFIVEAGARGLTIGKPEDKMGQRASGTVPLFFEGCRVPGSALLGTRGRGLSLALGALEGGRVGMAGLCLGIGEAAFSEGLRYACARTAFGQPIAEFQNSQFVLADSRTELDAAWLLTLRAARLLDQGQPASMEASMAKLYASEAADRACDKMLQLHGGYGYSREYRIEQLYRDSRVTRIYEGSSEVQRLVIARQLLREARG